MREFRDDAGKVWVARIQERPGDDYKGRYFFVASPAEGSASEEYPLEDVRWNSEKTAERTLRTMSEVELRRRLKIALGRGLGRVSPV